MFPPTPPASVPGLRVELLADVVDDLWYVFVKVVELVHKEGVLLVGVGGDVLQLVLGGPGDADGVGDHTCIRRRDGGLQTRTRHVFVTSNKRTAQHFNVDRPTPEKVLRAGNTKTTLVVMGK